MLREDIPDAQGAAITETLKGLGYEGLSVRQGKRFEVDVDGELTEERIDQLRKATEELLVNIEVEDYEISLVGNYDEEPEHDHDHHDHDHHDHDHFGHDHEQHGHDHADHEHGDHEHGDQESVTAEDLPPADDTASTGGQGE
jgi:phosphoribosylformylglycinamidine (FGAM) synthase PurS component